MSTAEKMIQDNGWPKSTKVTFISPLLLKNIQIFEIKRVVEGVEPAIFKQFFLHWNELEHPFAGFGRSFPTGAIAEWSIEDLHMENRKRIAKSAGSAIG